jgi:transcriptional regulator with XRE-family HTH domain
MADISGTNSRKAAQEATSDRDVLRCQLCGLVQYRTRTGYCRRCLRLLPMVQAVTLPPPQAPPPEQEAANRAWPNVQTVERIGNRVRQLREWRSMTQSQLQSRSKVSRSYLSRIESGQMTPSLGTLEKISEALGIGLNRFFLPENQGELMLEDPFIQNLRPYLRQLESAQWQSILKRLAAITEHVSRPGEAPGYYPAQAGQMAGLAGGAARAGAAGVGRAFAVRA